MTSPPVSMLPSFDMRVSLHDPGGCVGTFPAAIGYLFVCRADAGPSDLLNQVLSELSRIDGLWNRLEPLSYAHVIAAIRVPEVGVYEYALLRPMAKVRTDMARASAVLAQDGYLGSEGLFLGLLAAKPQNVARARHECLALREGECLNATRPDGGIQIPDGGPGVLAFRRMREARRPSLRLACVPLSEYSGGYHGRTRIAGFKQIG